MKEWKRIVIKIGTNVLADDVSFLNISRISSIVDQIVRLKKEEIEVVIVSSGAVGAGKTKVTLPDSLNRITKRQVYSSIGQIELMSRYQQLFGHHGINCAQVLATKEDFRDRVHFVNMKRCLLALLRDNLVPIVNENDVIAISELMFTDNDELAGLTASLIDADSLIILSNVDGVMRSDSNNSIMPSIHPNDREIFRHISINRSSFGRGGMISKVKFCQKAAKLGIQGYIANGKKPNILLEIRNKTGLCSYFVPLKKKSSVKKWMAYSDNEPIGYIVVNQGVERILRDPGRAASILPVGILEVSGSFQKGELIEVLNESEKRIGIGLAAYTSEEVKKILGRPSKKPVIHYDYLHIGE